jgi:hypothetical protein
MIPNSKEKQLEAVCALESCEHEKKWKQLFRSVEQITLKRPIHNKKGERGFDLNIFSVKIYHHVSACPAG